jgi:hypothetical protein
MSDELKKVRVLQDNGGGLIQIEDAFGDCWVKRGRVHKVGNDYVLSSERQAQIARNALARAEERKRKKQVEKTNQESETVEC